jgi:pimeloyl-ACP methyl ester carboxylesterase
MKPLENRLAEQGMPDTIRYSYASTRAAIGEHAAALRELLEDLPAEDTFSFVGHSMGNIVVRHLIGDLQRDGDPAKLLPRCRNMVMLGPPNQGAAIARRLAPTGLFGWITGQGGMELGAYWDTLKDNLAIPPFPFHIIAGDLQAPINNPLLDGSGDFIVGVDEARLEGAASFQTVPVLHSFLMDNEQAIEKTVALLQTPAAPPSPTS